jgi:predicted nucleic acid-binding protein
MNIFVDTGAFYALADQSDLHHASAADFYADSYGRNRFYTSDYVFIESWLLIRNKLGRPAAMTFWQTIRKGVVVLLPTAPVDLERAWQICEQYADQDFSLVDAISFALMERLNISTAFAFDHHFAVYRAAQGQVWQRVPAP